MLVFFSLAESSNRLPSPSSTTNSLFSLFVSDRLIDSFRNETILPWHWNQPISLCALMQRRTKAERGNKRNMKANYSITRQLIFLSEMKSKVSNEDSQGEKRSFDAIKQLMKFSSPLKSFLPSWRLKFSLLLLIQINERD